MRKTVVIALALLLVLGLVGLFRALPSYAATTNIAPAATVTASSQNTSTGQLAPKAVDGYIDGYPGDYTREWATSGGKAGSWLKLTWKSAQSISGITLYDRRNSNDQVTAATITFSDGTSVATGSLPNDGTAKTVTFTARATTSVLVRITGVSSTTQNIGLGEIQVTQAATTTTTAAATTTTTAAATTTTTTVKVTTTTQPSTTTTTAKPTTTTTQAPTTTTTAAGKIYNGTGTNLQTMVNNTPAGYTLVVPTGTYTISVPASNGYGLSLLGDRTYDFTRATINLAPNSFTNYSAILMKGVSNVTLKLGTVNGDRDAHTGSGGEWGMLVDMRGASNIKVIGGRVNKAWGDGVYLGANGSTMSSNIEVSGTIIRDCGRNGLSVTGCVGANIHDGYSFSCNRTDPMGGVGLEPNTGTKADGITVTNWWGDSNGNMGFYMNGAAGPVTNSKFVSCKAYRQQRGLYIINATGNSITNCTAIGNTNYNVKDYGGNTVSGCITSGTVPSVPNP